MPTPYEIGRRMEYEAVNALRYQGYKAQRTAGSHSPFDIVAWDGLEVKFIQVKWVRKPPDISTARTEAREAWEDKWPPLCEEIRVEAWIKQANQWHVFRLDQEDEST